MTHDMRTVSGVNQDLVVGVGFALHLLRAVSSGGLAFATARKTFHSYMIQTKKQVLVEGEKGRLTCQTWEVWCLCRRVGHATGTRRCLCSQTRYGEIAEDNNREKSELEWDCKRRINYRRWDYSHYTGSHWALVGQSHCFIKALKTHQMVQTHDSTVQN